MSRQYSQLVNQLPVILPENVVAPTEWLLEQGYSRQLLSKYKDKWLQQPANGVYLRNESPVTWEGAMLGLQKLANLPFHVGGITALNLQGFAHYLPLSGNGQPGPVHLWGFGRLPGWVRKLPVAKHWVFHTRQLFTATGKKPVNATGLVDWPTKIRDWQIQISGPERAILEVLSEVSHQEASFIFAAELFEGLAVLRPKLLNQLLKQCTHIKAKRLFLFLAHYFEHPWLKRLDWQSLDLGNGKRAVVKGGKLDKRFNITVPKTYHAQQR